MLAGFSQGPAKSRLLVLRPRRPGTGEGATGSCGIAELQWKHPCALRRVSWLSRSCWGSHPDLHLIAPDGGSIKLEQIRALQHVLSLQPYLGSYRVCVVQGGGVHDDPSGQ